MMDRVNLEAIGWASITDITMICSISSMTVDFCLKIKPDNPKQQQEDMCFDEDFLHHYLLEWRRGEEILK
jgi:hypothetical protein